MKKRIALLLAVVLVMFAVLVACKDGGENPPNGDHHIYSFSYNGVNIRVTYGYDMKTKKNMLSLDTIYGFAPLYPSLAAVVMG